NEPHDAVSYPRAQNPDRTRRVSSHGLALHVNEWGAAGDRPLLLAHGGFDFSRTFDVFAPLLAQGGWRVVSWDQRGHGDSQHAALYSWDADLRDAVAVMDSVGAEPMPVIGHSKGGSILLQLADACPHRVSHLVNLDGLPSKRQQPDIADHERTRMRAGELALWLDHRRRAAEASRKPGTLEELASRRARMNPRLPHDWLRYLVTVGARRDPDGWRWKIDPALRMGGFGPWRPEWNLHRMPGLGVPMLGVLGLVMEQMGWGTTPDDVLPYLPAGAELMTLADTGHFVHIEKPDEVAKAVLEFLA
ncbi:MAG TPA: alpha/beta hydrolase, partial [Acidimicrobiales bacterium]|nr:alpha/beta hydrolase [Acidimicrobiales bacterium]